VKQLLLSIPRSASKIISPGAVKNCARRKNWCKHNIVCLLFIRARIAAGRRLLTITCYPELTEIERQSLNHCNSAEPWASFDTQMRLTTEHIRI